MARDDYRRIAPWYDLVVDPLLQSLRRTGFNLFQAAQDLRVLEIGCGTGSQMAFYRERGIRITGIDRSCAMLQVARARLGPRALLCRGDGARLPCPDGAFDLVLAVMVLHEITSATRRAVLADMARVLHPAGRLGIIDYHPLPARTFKGFLARRLIQGVERAAGHRHHTNYRNFLREGGLPALADRQGLHIEGCRRVGGGNIGIYRLRRATPGNGAHPGPDEAGSRGWNFGRGL